MTIPRSCFVWFGGLIALSCFAIGAQGAAVGPTGYTNAFTTLPAATDWSQFDLTGANTLIATPADMDTQVAAIPASAANTVLNTDVNPASTPLQNALGNWNQAGGYLYTRPTGNAASMIMCTLVNNIGSDAGTVTLSYDFTRVGILPEDDPAFNGHRVYYSLTGLANSWTVIPAFTVTDGAFTSGRLTASIDLAWPSGGNLYVLWADDNSQPSSPDTGLEIDNFSASATSAVPIPEMITNQPSSLTVNELAPASFTVAAAGNPRPDYQWFQDNVLIPNATNATYSIASVPLSFNN